MHKKAKYYENHHNPVLLVFIGKLSVSTITWVPICQGLSHLPGFLHNFVLAKLATSIIRVKCKFTKHLKENYWWGFRINIFPISHVLFTDMAPTIGTGYNAIFSPHLCLDSLSKLVLSMTALLPWASACLHASTHFCHVFRVSWNTQEVRGQLHKPPHISATSSGYPETHKRSVVIGQRSALQVFSRW